MRHLKWKSGTVLGRTNATQGRTGLMKLLLLVSISIAVTGCAALGTPVPLHRFIDDLRAELSKTSAVTRLTVTQVAAGQGADLLRREQDAQCSSDPILLFLGGDLVFKLKATVGGDVGAALTPVPAPTVKITGSGEHALDWKVAPISLGNLANVIFAGDIQTVQSIRNIEGAGAAIETKRTKMIKEALLKEAWDLRDKLMKVADTLIKDWRKPLSCP